MMRFKTLLIAVVVLAAAAAVVQYRQAQKFAADTQPLLLPALAGQLDAITAVAIIAAGADTLNLQRGDDGWRLIERDYPADASALRRALRKLADARKLEAKTALADNYARLGVQDVDLASDTTVALRASTADGQTVLNLIIGKSGPGGQYVRLAGEAQSWLIDQSLSLPRRAPEWLDKALVSLPRDALRRIQVEPVSGPGYALVSPATDEDDTVLRELELQPPPSEGRQTSAANINRLGAALAGLRIEDVLVKDAPGDLDWARLRFEGRDGLILAVEVARQDSNRYLRLAAEGEHEQVASINARAQGRTFLAPQHAVDAMLMSYEMLLRPLD